MLRKRGRDAVGRSEFGRGREQREGSHAGARALKRRRVLCADHAGRQQHRGRVADLDGDLLAADRATRRSGQASQRSALKTLAQGPGGCA